jgi:hypothetical protein
MSVLYTPGIAQDGTHYIKTLSWGTHTWNFDAPDVLRQMIEERRCPFIKYLTINLRQIDHDDDITVVMTTHDRSQQTLNTLKSIAKSSVAQKVIIIVVDDSDEGFLTIEQLLPFNLPIIYIMIDNAKKTWFNPCVNYNIGFNEVKTRFVLIQNAEVCHVGDILAHVKTHLKDDNYLIFDVVASHSNELNQTLQGLTYAEVTDRLSHLEKETAYKWIQCDKLSRNLHNLVAITDKNLKCLKGFDYQFAYGACFDDDEWLFRVTHLPLKLENVWHQDTQLMGIHQMHKQMGHYHVDGIMRINWLIYMRMNKDKKSEK